MMQNKEMRFLVTGASGFIGKRFYDALVCAYGKKTVLGTYNRHEKPAMVNLDITDREKIEALGKRHQPNVVIHSAALPGVNLCETERELSYKLNFEGTRNIVDVCKLHKAKMVFLSTNYLFDGVKGNYSEDEPASPINYYGILKLKCENYISDNLDDFLILRTTNVYGYDPESKNFAMTTIDALGSGKHLKAANDQYGNPTHVNDLVKAGLELLQRGKKGIYNVAGPDNLNRLEFAQCIAEVFGLDKSLIIGLPTEMLAEAAPRPKQANFDISKIRRELKTKMMGTREGLEYMKEEIYNAKGK